MLRKRWKCEVNEEERCGQCLLSTIVQKRTHEREATQRKKNDMVQAVTHSVT